MLVLTALFPCVWGTHTHSENATVFWREGPCSTGFPHWVSILGTHLYQCTSWHYYERLHPASVNCFWRFFQHVCPVHHGWFMRAPDHTHTECSAVLTKKWGGRHVHHAPLSVFTQSCPRQLLLLLFPWMKKVLKGKCFAIEEEVKQKMAEALKGIEVNKFKNCFKQWENFSIGVRHRMESTLKVTEV